MTSLRLSLLRSYVLQLMLNKTYAQSIDKLSIKHKMVRTRTTKKTECHYFDFSLILSFFLERRRVYEKVAGALKFYCDLPEFRIRIGLVATRCGQMDNLGGNIHPVRTNLSFGASDFEILYALSFRSPHHFPTEGRFPFEALHRHVSYDAKNVWSSIGHIEMRIVTIKRPAQPVDVVFLPASRCLAPK